MKTRLYVLIAILLTAAMLLSACAKPAPEVKGLASYQDGKPFRFIGTNREVPVVKIMIAGFLQACTDFQLQCELMTVDGNDIAKSVELTEQSVSLGSSGILATVYDKAWYGAVNKAIASGIPVVNGHFPMTSDILPGLKGWVAPDNVAYAIQAADLLAKTIGDAKGSIAITSSTTNDGENAVAKAFRDEFKVANPRVKILDVQFETTDPAKAIAVTSAIIQANPDLLGAFSTTGGGATAWAASARENNLAAGKLVIIGMDASRENLDLVKNGEVLAVVAQPLYQEMYEGVVLLLETRIGLPIPYENVLPAPLVMKADVQPYYDILKKAEAVK